MTHGTQPAAGPGLTVAYCAPGRQRQAAELLASKSESYDELVEHPFLHNFDGVMLARPAAMRVNWRGSVISRDMWDEAVWRWRGRRELPWLPLSWRVA